MAETAATQVKKKKRRRKKKLNKSLKTLIIIGCVILVLVLVLVILLPILQNSAEKKAAAEQEESSSVEQPVSTACYLLNTEEDNIATVEVTNYEDEDCSYTLKRIGSGVFDFPVLKGYDLQQDSINSLGSSFKRIFAIQTVEDSSDPSIFGLDSPSMQIAYTFSDDTEPLTLEIGDQVPGQDYYYGRPVGDEEIYVLSGISSFIVNPVSYVSTTATELPSKLFNDSGTWSCEEDFDYIDVSGTGLAGGDVHCEPADMSGYSKVVASAYTYSITDGTHNSLLNTSIEETCQGTGVFGMVAEECVAIGSDEATLKEYGLDEPYKQLNLSIMGQEYVLKCAPVPDETGYYYVVTNFQKAIFKVSAETLTWVDFDYKTMATAIIFAPYIDSTASIELDFGDGEKHVLTANCPETSTDLEVQYNGSTEIDPDDYRTFFSLIIYASADEFLTGEEDLTVDPSLTITYTQEDGTVDVIKYIPISSRSVAIDYNGTCQFYMRAEFIDKIARELDNLVAGNAVTSTW